MTFLLFKQKKVHKNKGKLNKK